MSLAIGIVQFEAVDDVATNRQTALDLGRKASDAGAELVMFHELAMTQYFPAFATDDAYFDKAEPLDGPSLAAFRELAAKTGTAFLVPWFEREAAGRYFNSAAFVTHTGEIAHVWRKTHIPRIQVPEGNVRLQFDEKYYFEPGHVPHAVINWKGIAIGGMVCHDRHFPEVPRALALAGAELILIPATTRGIPGITDAWTVELRAAAIQNVAYVAATNRVGTEQGQTFHGASLVYGPGGEEVAMADAAPGFRVAEIQPETVDRARVGRGFFRDRRPEHYAELLSIPAGVGR